MPLSLDQISAITQKKFIPKLVDNIFDSDALLARMKKKDTYKKLDGGTSVVLPLGYALTSAAGWYSGTETLDTTDNETTTGAEYSWKQAFANISINRLDELKNSGDSQILDHVKTKTQNAEKTLTDYIQGGLYSAGTNAKSIVGLGSIIGTSNTIGAISQSTYSWWQAQVDSSTTTLTLASMQTVYMNLCINNEQPTVIMSTRANYNRFYALLQPQQRFMDGDTAKAGFTSLMFNGTPFIVGSKVPTSNIMYLNENYLMLGAHKDEDFRFEPFVKPTNQNVKVGKVYWAGIFGSSNNRMQGKQSAIAA